MPVIPLKPSLYILNIYVRLRILRLLRPSYKSPYAIGAIEAGLCFRHLELCLCCHYSDPPCRAVQSLSRRCYIAVESPSRRCRDTVTQVAYTTPIKTLL